MIDIAQLSLKLSANDISRTNSHAHLRQMNFEARAQLSNCEGTCSADLDLCLKMAFVLNMDRRPGA